MTTFCSGTPAVASQVNGNFKQVVDWTAAKVGTMSDPNVTAAGNVTVAGNLTEQKDVTVAGGVNFGASMRQMVTLWNPGSGIGVQSNTVYFRSSSNFAWFMGGAHSNGQIDPGSGGTTMMSLKDDGTLSVRSLLYDYDGTSSAYYNVTSRRYVLDASPNKVGVVVP
jgi:hypothetical protein